MGSTISFILAARVPEVAAHIKLNVAIAPVVFGSHIKSPIKFLTPFAKHLDWIRTFLGISEFLPHYEIFNKLANDCTSELFGILCENLFFLMFGYDGNEFNSEILPSVMYHLPAGTSTKTILHLAQVVANKNQFMQYDYGVGGNMQRYGEKLPPVYNLTNTKMPVYLMYAENDMFSTEKDVLLLRDRIKNVIGVYKVPKKGFSHIDFNFGKSAYNLVYTQLLEVMKNYTTS